MSFTHVSSSHTGTAYLWITEAYCRMFLIGTSYCLHSLSLMASLWLFPQRPVSSLSEGFAVCPQSSALSTFSAAPAAPGSAFSAHAGYTHCWLPSGTAGWPGQVQIYVWMKRGKETNLFFHRNKACYTSSVFTTALREKSVCLLLQWHGVMSQGCRHPYWGIWKLLSRALIIQFRQTAASLWFHPTWSTLRLITTSSQDRYYPLALTMPMTVLSLV